MPQKNPAGQKSAMGNRAYLSAFPANPAHSKRIVMGGMPTSLRRAALLYASAIVLAALCSARRAHWWANADHDGWRCWGLPAPSRFRLSCCCGTDWRPVSFR